MKKYFFTFLIMACATICFSQTTKEGLEKAKKDPKLVEKAAKADSRLINQKNIGDSSRFNKQIPKRKKFHKKPYRRQA